MQEHNVNVKSVDLIIHAYERLGMKSAHQYKPLIRAVGSEMLLKYEIPDEDKTDVM
jgi:hypothetical protein